MNVAFSPLLMLLCVILSDTQSIKTGIRTAYQNQLVESNSSIPLHAQLLMEGKLRGYGIDFPRKRENVTTSRDRRLDGGIRHIKRITELANELKVNNQVMVTYTTYNYLKAFYVSYITSKLWKYKNFFVVALDSQSYDVLEKQGYPVALLKSKVRIPKEQEASKYGTHNFNVIMLLKVFVIRAVLSQGIGILIFDSDVIIFKDPFAVINTYQGQHFVAQQDENLCAGFIYFFPTKESFLATKYMEDEMMSRDIHDQDALISLITAGRLPFIRYMLLPQHLYSSGKRFFSEHNFYWNSIQESQIQAHNNYIIGMTYKLYRLKENGLYDLDIDGEYSDSAAKLLQIENDFGVSGDPTEPLIGRMDMNTFLTLMIDIANTLERSLVLPSFRCMDRQQQCNLCDSQFIMCHAKEMDRAALPWKEHVFFHNPKVPMALRLEAINNPIYMFVSSRDACKHMKAIVKHGKCVRYSTMVSFEENVEKLKQLNWRGVLRIYTIPPDFPRHTYE